MRRALPWLALACLSSSVAMAHPVRVGRYTEIPYGIDPRHPYPAARGGPDRAGRLRHLVPTERPDRMWERSLPHRRPRGPTIAADGSLYFATDHGLVSLDAEGVERWHLGSWAVDAAPSLTPAGDLVAVTRQGLVLLVSRDGVLRRSATLLGDSVRAPPLVLDDGSIVIGTMEGRVHRLDANLRRSFVTPLGDGAPSVVTRTRRGAFAVPAGTALVLLGPRGGLFRQVSLGGRATSPVAVADDGTLWTVTADGVLFGLDGGGRVRSRTELGTRHYAEAAIAVARDGSVRVPTMGGGLVCVGPSGAVRWAAGTDTVFMAPAVVDDAGTTLAVDRGARMVALDPEGAERWRVLLGAYTYDSPVLGADGTIYISTERGAVQAWRRGDE